MKGRRTAIYLVAAERERSGVCAWGRFERFAARVPDLRSLKATRAQLAALLGEFDAGVVTVLQLRVAGTALLAQAAALEHLSFAAFDALQTIVGVTTGQRLEADCSAGHRLQRLGFALRVTL